MIIEAVMRRDEKVTEPEGLNCREIDDLYIFIFFNIL